ncbi:DNA polymerase beta domain protein region [Gloeocapsa sp. PCC 7428]|uniref:nucleotidyltransferase family protein n=1 Tax=Gloeocapsa sp. PCC 7428 TaxID=1173026 RepID=UPI0002A5F3C0|nr:nucleotidyltransferase [Gloeocapsa sp. PCC 7428]AFZ28787.1 DNA polymerase beta domain protein region [Gloeocapsa sp. PCC 7428]
MKTLPIDLPKAEIYQLCQQHCIRKLALFGSVLCDDFTKDSDIDVLVEFEVGKIPGLAIVRMEDELSHLLGRVVDLRTPADLSCYFRDRVLQEAMIVYEQD